MKKFSRIAAAVASAAFTLTANGKARMPRAHQRQSEAGSGRRKNPSTRNDRLPAIQGDTAKEASRSPGQIPSHHPRSKAEPPLTHPKAPRPPDRGHKGAPRGPHQPLHTVSLFFCSRCPHPDTPAHAITPPGRATGCGPARLARPAPVRSNAPTTASCPD